MVEFKAFDYKNPIHQQIGVALTSMYYWCGDFKMVYEFEDHEFEDSIYSKVLNNMVWDKKFTGPSPEGDDIFELWLEREKRRFLDIGFLQINFKNTAQTLPGEDIYDVDGGVYSNGDPDPDPAGGHGLHFHE